MKMKGGKKIKQSKSNIAKIHLIRMNLLVHKQDFQDLVRKIRKNINLPFQGLSFEKEQSKEYDDWFRWFAGENEIKVKEANTLLQKSYENYQKQIQLHIRYEKIKEKQINSVADNTHRLKKFWDSKKWQDEEKEDRKIKSQLKPEVLRPEFMWQERDKILSLIPENYLNEQIDDIINNYHLPDSYQKTVEWYILFNKIQVPAANFLIGCKYLKVPRWTGPEEITDWSGKSRHIAIDVFSPLTNGEIKNLVTELREIQKDVFSKGVLASIKPQTKIEKLLELAGTDEVTKKNRGRPEKKENYLINSKYFQQLEKAGFSEKQRKKIAREQSLAGKRPDSRKQKIEKTSGDIAKKYLGSYRKSATVRRARFKIKKLETRLFSPE